MQIRLIYFTALGLSLLAGCSTPADARRSWIATQGGLINDCARQQRLDAIAARLTAKHPALRVEVRILASGAVCAYAWPKRTVFVTRGLLDRADDDVVAAAVAHEMGHFASDGHARPVVSVKGYHDDSGAEGLADAYGVELLRLQRLPPDAMVGMLRLVRDCNPLPGACVSAMNRRIDRLVGPSAAGNREK